MLPACVILSRALAEFVSLASLFRNFSSLRESEELNPRELAIRVLLWTVSCLSNNYVGDLS
jgi:hypothetical protein